MTSTIREVVVLEAGAWNASLEIYPLDCVKRCFEKTQFEGMKVEGINGDRIGEVKSARMEDGKIITEIEINGDFESNYFLEGGFNQPFEKVQEIGWGSL